MKLLALLALVVPLTAAAQYRPLETSEEARQRREAERYEVRRDRGGSEPLGGYRERLGDPGGADTFRTRPREQDDERQRDRGEQFGSDRGYIDPVTRPRR